LITKMLIYNSAISTDLCLAPIWLKPSHLIFLTTVPKVATRPILFRCWKFGFAFGIRFLVGCIECIFAVQTVVLPRLMVHFVVDFTLCSYCMCLATQITEGCGWSLGQKPSISKQFYMMHLITICTRSYFLWRPTGLQTFSFDIED
jgi:hypothetical protein